MTNQQSTVNSKKTILILGSAPEVTVPECNILYAANRAAFFHRRKIEHVSERIVVAGAHVIAGNPLQKLGRPAIDISNEFMETGIKELFILDHQPYFSEWELEKKIYEMKTNSTFPIEVISIKDRYRLEKKIIGMSEPIISIDSINEAIYLPINAALRGFSKQIKSTIRSRLNTKRECHPSFRPSTGILTALVAIERNGPDAKYLVSGIGLKNTSDRDAYSDGNLSAPTDFTGHLFADRKIWGVLTKRYNISLVEP